MAPTGGGGGARPTDEHPTPTPSSSSNHHHHHHHHHNNNNNDNDVEDYLLSEETLERMLQSGHYQDDDDADDQGSFDGDDIKEELDRLAAAEEDLRNEMELVMGSFRLGSSLTTTTEEDGVVDDDDDGSTSVGEETTTRTTRTSAMASVEEEEEEEEEEARNTTRESPRGAPSELDDAVAAALSSPLRSPSSSSSSSIFRSRDASVEHRAREDYASYVRTRWRRRAEDMGVTRVGAAEEDAWYRCPLPNSVPLSSPHAAAMAHCHADYVQPLSSHALRRAHVGVAPPRGDNGAVARLRASAKYDIRPPEPSPLRTSALRIRPDVLCGAVMDTLMTVVRDREGETVKRQGGHLLAVLPGVWLKKRERRRSGNHHRSSSGEEAVAVAADHGEDHAHAPLKRRRRRKVWLPPACVDAQLCTKKIGGDCERVLLVRVYEMTSSSSSNHAHHSNHHHNNNGNGLLSRRLGGGDAGADGHSVGSVLDPDDVDDDSKYADKRDGKCVRERYSDSQDILRDAAYTIYQMDREEEEERRFAEEGDDDDDDDEEEDDDGTTATNDERNMSIRHSFSSTFHGRRSSPRQRTPTRRPLSTSLHGGGGRRDASDGRSSSATAGGGGLSLLGSLLASPLRALATGLQNHNHHNHYSGHLSSRGDASFADDRSVASLRSLPATPRNSNGGAANTTIPALSSKYANILQSAFRFLTAVISELEARGLAYTTLAYADDHDDDEDDHEEEEDGVVQRVRDGAARPPAFGTFPALPTLDAHYCSQLRLVCRETMIRKLLRSASELEQYARETERAGVAFVRLLREGVCVDYDVAPPDMPRLVPLTAYPMDFQSPEARCPPWGEEVAEALRVVREESSSRHDGDDSPASAARAVRRVVDAFAAQDDAERCARMTRKNTQVVDRIAKMRAFVRESVDRIRDAHKTRRAATRAADSFRDMAGRAESPVPLSGTTTSQEEEDDALPVSPADQVPLLKCGVSEVGADGGAGSCYVASRQMLLATRVIPFVGGSRYTLLDTRRCALVVVGGRGRPGDDDDDDAGTVVSSLRRDRSALSVRRLRTRDDDDDDRPFDRDPAWIMQNSDEVCSFVPSLGAERLKTFVDTVRSVAEETAAEEASTLRLTSKGGMLYDDAGTATRRE